MVTQLNELTVSESQNVTRQIKDEIIVENGIIKIISTLMVPDPPSSAVVAQVNTLTITAGLPDDIYSIAITSNGTTEYADTLQISGDTEGTIATRLAEEIQNNTSKVSASVTGAVVTFTGAVVTLTSNTPGEVVTYSVASSSTPSNAVVGNVTAASGTLIPWKIQETTISSTSNNGNFTQTIEANRYNGGSLTASTPTSSKTFIHPLSIPTLIANAIAG